MASRLIYWLRSVRPGEIKKQLRVRVCEDLLVWRSTTGGMPFVAARPPVRPLGIKLPRRAGCPTGASSSIGALGKAGLLYGAAVPPAPRLHTMSSRLVIIRYFSSMRGSCRQRIAPVELRARGFAAGRALSGVALVLSTFGATPLHDGPPSRIATVKHPKLIQIFLLTNLRRIPPARWRALSGPKASPCSH